MEQVNKYTVLGCMSGTSLDGLDLALCHFEHQPHSAVSWRFEIEAARTIQYTPAWRERLASAHLLPADELTLLDRGYGVFVGEAVREFLANEAPDAVLDLVVSHGHTVFHAPQKGYTLQIGHLSGIALTGGWAVLGDLRSGDVAMGGQGAPLVPVGDRYLFQDFAACVNLGGFANVSMERAGRRIAWDICPLNTVMNRFASLAGSAVDYDPEGGIARSGKLIPELFEHLESLPFYRQHAPKSLGREWVEAEVFPLLEGHDASDVLHTFTVHAAQRIAHDLRDVAGAVLLTGGGSYNAFLIEQLKARTSAHLAIPPAEVIEFKEALVFAFLGALWLRGDANVLASVTGAQRDHRSGVYVPKP